jgi:L-2-hydroxyglutarate oxidase
MHFDFIIIGGGIVGASTAWQLKKRFADSRFLLLEKENSPALHQSGRNSGVIHAGIYYQPGSLKAQFCRDGLAETIEFCRAHGIPYRQCGKLLVATGEADLPRLEALLSRCRTNGAAVERLSAAELRAREPNVSGIEALLVPESGITDYRRICAVMLDEFRRQGGECRYGIKVRSISESGSGVIVDAGGTRFEGGFLVACAGLQSDRLAALHGLEPEFRIVPFRGGFFRLAPRLRGITTRLVYPVPDPSLPFVGVHLTPTIDGEVIVGPNALPVLKREGYAGCSLSARDAVDMFSFRGFRRMARRHWRAGCAELWRSVSRRAYVAELRRLCPVIEAADLLPHPAGIRAQAVFSDGSLVHDFLFAESPRSLHVCNAPSPAATSSIPIGAYLVDRVAAKLG